MPALRLQGLQGQRPAGLAAQRARLSGQTETGGWMLSDGVEMMARWLPALPLNGPVPVVLGCLCQTPPCSGTVKLELDVLVPQEVFVF
jgi:hypothetical protein